MSMMSSSTLETTTRSPSLGAYWRAHRRLIGALIFYVPAGAVLLFGLLMMLRSTIPFSADGLWLFSVAHDIREGTPLSGWKLPGAPLYFPDLLSVFAWTSLGLGVGQTVLLHGVISWLLISTGIAWALRIAGLSWTQSARIAFLTMLGYVFIYGDSRLLSEFHFPFSHGGATLCSFLGLVFIGRGLKSGYNRFSACAAIGLVALHVASDRAVLAQFVLPAALAALVFLVFRWAPRAHLMWTLGLLGAGSLLGWVITGSINWLTSVEPIPLPSGYTWAASMATLNTIITDLSKLAFVRPLVLASVVLPVVFLVFIGITGAQRRLRANRDPRPVESSRLLEWWLTCSGLIVLFATVSAVVVTHSWTPRYILPVFVLPLALAVAAAGRRLQRMSSGLTRALEVGLLIITAVLATDKSKAAVPLDLYTPTFACLDQFVTQQGLHAGYSEYWQSRPPMVLGRTRLTIAEVTARLTPRRWANNAFWYSRGYYPNLDRPPRYDFIITNRLDEGWLTSRFGAPRVKESCAGYNLWVYDRPVDLEFRNYLRTPMAQDTKDHEGWWESSTIAAARDKGLKRLSFDGGAGISLEFPRVPANVIEVVSPSRKPLVLHYKRDGVEIASQQVDFKDNGRRILPMPTKLGSLGVDSVTVRGAAGVIHDLETVVLMLDKHAEAARL